MKKWYVIYVTGEATGMWPVELDEHELTIVLKVFNAKHDGLFEDYCGSVDFEYEYNEKTAVLRSFDTKDEAMEFIRNHLYDDAHKYDEDFNYFEELEETENDYVYKCPVCGYESLAPKDLDELYLCPICGQKRN